VFSPFFSLVEPILTLMRTCMDTRLKPEIESPMLLPFVN